MIGGVSDPTICSVEFIDGREQITYNADKPGVEPYFRFYVRSFADRLNRLLITNGEVYGYAQPHYFWLLDHIPEIARLYTLDREYIAKFLKEDCDEWLAE